MSLPPIVTQHLVAAAVCLVGLSAAGGKRSAVEPAQLVMDLGGPGPSKVGTSVGEAALVVPLADDREHEPGECHYVIDPGDGQRLMILESKGKAVASFRAGERESMTFQGCE